jgi:hypothetical protein
MDDMLGEVYIRQGKTLEEHTKRRENGVKKGRSSRAREREGSFSRRKRE